MLFSDPSNGWRLTSLYLANRSVFYLGQQKLLLLDEKVLSYSPTTDNPLREPDLPSDYVSEPNFLSSNCTCFISKGLFLYWPRSNYILKDNCFLTSSVSHTKTLRKTYNFFKPRKIFIQQKNAYFEFNNFPGNTTWMVFAFLHNCLSTEHLRPVSVGSFSK